MKWLFIPLFAFISSAGLAGGHYNVTYSSGGQAEIKGPNNQIWNAPYHNTNWGFGGAWISQNAPGPGGQQGVAGPGYVHCNGAPITATCTWDNEGDPYNVPPDQIVVIEKSFAWYTATSGSCANGLGSPMVVGGDSGISDGHRVTIMKGKLSFPLTISPSASGDLPVAAGGLLAALAGVEYRVEIVLPDLIVNGLTRSGGAESILMGQMFTATPSLPQNGPGVFADYHSWSTSIRVWDNVERNGPFVGPEGNYFEPWQYWGGLTLDTGEGGFFEEDGAETLGIDATIFYQETETSPIETVGSMTLKKSFHVDAPVYYFGYSLGPCEYITESFESSAIVGVMAGENPNAQNSGQPGFYGEGWVRTQEKYWSTGVGEWAFTQKVILDRRQYHLAGTWACWPTTTDGERKLDNTYAYNPEWPDPFWPANHDFDSDAVDGTMTDSPDYWWAVPSVNHVTVDDQYFTYQQYEPPPSPNVNGSEVVPLHLVKWAWNVDCTRSFLIWSQPPGTVDFVESFAMPGCSDFGWYDTYLNGE